MEKQLLVAIDRSISSSNIFHYLSTVFADTNDVRLHLLSVMQANSLTSGTDWLDESDIFSMLGQQDKNRYTSMRRYLETCKSKLVRQGFSPEQITTEIKISKGSIIQDILFEANQKLYDAILVGRYGNDKISNMFMDSIASALLEHSQEIPVWVIDGHIDSRKFLVPVDGTNQSLRAVEHLAFIMKDNPSTEITLFNSESLFTRSVTINPEDYYQQWTKQWADEHLDRPDSLFHGPEQLLVQNGFPRERLKRLTNRKGLYPSRQIVRQALIGDFGTIVMGCRPKGLSNGLFKSVTAKVFAMAEDVAIWVVECS